MPDDHDIRVLRGDLQLTVEMALRKAQSLRPKRRRPGDHDRLKPVAEAVVDLLELCGMRYFQKALEHGEPHLFSAARRSALRISSRDFPVAHSSRPMKLGATRHGKP